ncbi:MAG: helix-turn-helix transcriptional regulator [Pseudomonadota bacterium]
MTQATPSASVSSAPTKSFEKVVSQPGTTTETTSYTRCQVFAFDHYSALQPKAPAKHTAIGDLVGQWDKDDMRREAMEEARRWAADTLHGDDGDSVRNMRLRKGWSQTRLAEELSTSQSHVARIERGTENLAIETCRKLCRALDIDMNALDQALKRQEVIAQEKVKSK